ncbi:LOW QUALITY PROTEIN: epidermal growth factor receptor kinase substrate 8-like protein 3 [Leptosomus discolor]
MGDTFRSWSNPSSRSEYDNSSLLRPSNSFARPSGKSIYKQRKDYVQTLLKSQSDFQHHVEHLLTLRLERDIRSTDDCLARLKVLEAQGRVWGQDLILQVKDQELVLRDVESKEELDAYPLGSVQGCSAVLDVGGYDSVLAISVQELSPPGTSVLLFQCGHLGAETLKNSLEKVVKEWKEEQRSQHGHRNSLDMPPSPVPQYPPGPWTAPSGLPDTPQTPLTNPPGQVMSNVDRDVEILNHVLSDLDLFVVRLKTALGSASTTKLKKKKMKNKGALPSEEDYTDFFQKVKYAFNLMGRTHQDMREPDPSELLHLIFMALSFVLEQCPNRSLAPAVEAPLLLPEAVELLEKTLHQDDHRTWKSLGSAWNKTRATYPNGELVPSYTPVFSDGWLPPPVEQSPLTSRRDDPGQGAPPCPGAGPSLYEFQGRNPQELSIRMGDTLQVLDQRKKWWLLQDDRGKKGYVPSNILEPLGKWHGVGDSASQVGVPPSPPPTPPPHREGMAGDHPAVPSPRPLLQDSPHLHPDSSPAEVTAWLKDKGFSRITVRCLGVLRGSQLLQMTPEELRAVCPEVRRVLFKLSSVRTSWG